MLSYSLPLHIDSDVVRDHMSPAFVARARQLNVTRGPILSHWTRRQPREMMTTLMSPRRRAEVELILDARHYEAVVQGAIQQARVSLWIGTANVKDVRVEAPLGTAARARGRFISITECFVDLARRGVEIRLLHAGPVSRAFLSALHKCRELKPPIFDMRTCPRTHLKMIAVDGSYLYVGSANLTGAGLGAKGEQRRNFEMGFVTEDDVLLDQAQFAFDRIWTGRECSGCRLRAQCPKPLDL